MGVALAAIATFGFESAAFARFVQVDPRQVSILVTLCVATALLYPLLRRVTSWFVDTIVLRRPDYSTLRARIVSTSHGNDDIPTLLSAVCDLLAPALSARFVTWRQLQAPAQREPLAPAVVSGPEVALIARSAVGAPLDGGVATLVTVQTTEPPRFIVAIGQLSVAAGCCPTIRDTRGDCRRCRTASTRSDHERTLHA